MAATTSDPVTPAEIANRIGTSPSHVRAMVTRGQLPAPDWTPRGTGLWAWEALADHPTIRAALTAGADDGTIDAAEAAARVGRSTDTISRWRRDGLFNTVTGTAATGYRFDPAEVDAVAASLATGTAG